MGIILEMDLYGNFRIKNGETVDIGAFENTGFIINEKVNTLIQADGSCQNEDGWISFFEHDDKDEIQISIHTHMQDIGDIEVYTYLNDLYGSDAHMLSMAFGQKKIHPL